MAQSGFQSLVKAVSDSYDSDVILYMGPIDRPYDDSFIARVKTFKRRKNVLILLTTPGGDPHAAFRIARCLQEQYNTGSSAGNAGAAADSVGKFRLYVDTRCKSAGTILATGATSILFSDYGELGPIDVQLRKGDEVGERSSGLTPMHALESLQQLASKHFEDFFKALRFSPDLAFSTKSASEIATNLTVGLFSEIYGQIDPLRIGEFDRAMRISGDYGTRLGRGNLKEDALKRLLVGYPSHGFVIDKKEAQDLFKSVEDPTEELVILGQITREWHNALSDDPPLILYLTTDDILRGESDAEDT